MFGRDALAIVSDTEDHVSSAPGGADGHMPPGGGMPQGVVGQIAQHLHESLPVGPNPTRVSGAGFQHDALSCVAVGERSTHRTDDFGGVDPSPG